MPKTKTTPQQQTPAEKCASITWAKRLKRVVAIDVETCSACGGDARIIACTEDPVVIRKILVHLADKVTCTTAGSLPTCRIKGVGSNK